MKFIILSFSLFFITNSFPQVENVPAGHPVYPFLKKMKVHGILKNYDDVILPLSKEAIINALIEIDSSRTDLSLAEQGFLDRMKEKLFINLIDHHPINLFNNFPSGIINNLLADKQKHLYHYKDSSIVFYIDPIAEYKFIYSGLIKDHSSLINYGGKFRGTYDGWFGFNFQGTIGIQAGNREAALLDKRVEQSFTFNTTEQNYFDDTEGYIIVKKGIISFQLGRERILWGTGYIDKMFLSNNPPKFDFIRFNLSYKTLSYNFIHGWLTQPSIVIYSDTLVGDIMEKPSKYLGISRLGFQPSYKLSLGVSQVIIYADRPFEAAYLNPFLFWESAQRSLNDLDNAYLAFDGRYLITNGLEISAAVIFDDIDLEKWSNGEWTNRSNRLAWQTGAIITDPLLFDNLTLKLEYEQIRPYTFSHFGFNESLTFTNNRYLLGMDLQPNSTRFSVEIYYRISERLNLEFTYKHSLHGNNIYDDEGNLIKSVGGDIFRPIHSIDNITAPLLDGIREVTDNFFFNAVYEITYGIYLNFSYQHERRSIKDIKTSLNNFFGSIKLSLE